MSWKRILLVSALALVFVSQPLLTSPSGAAEKKVLSLGSLVPMNLKEGLEIKRWNDLLAKMINEQGGWQVGGQKYEVKWYTYDVGYGDTGKHQAALQRAIFQDKVQIFLNDFGDTPTITAAAADENKIIVLGVGFDDEVVSTKYQYFFRPNGGFFGRAMNYAIYQDYYKAGAKTYVVSTPDSEWSRISAGQYGAAAKLAGLKVLDPIYFTGDTVDFGPVATKILSIKADVVDMCVCNGSQVTNLTSALRDVGWKGKIFPGAGLGKDTLVNIVKKVGNYFDGTEMLYFDPRGIPVVTQNPEMKALLDRYMKEYGEFQTEGCFWIGSWFIFKDAVNATKSVDPDALKKYLENGPPGVMDLTGYTQLFARPDLKQFRTVDAAPGHGIGIVKNGQLVFTSQITMQDQYLISLKCYEMVGGPFKGILDTYQKHWDKYGKPTFPKGEEKLNRSTWEDLRK